MGRKGGGGVGSIAVSPALDVDALLWGHRGFRSRGEDTLTTSRQLTHKPGSGACCRTNESYKSTKVANLTYLRVLQMETKTAVPQFTTYFALTTKQK